MAEKPSEQRIIRRPAIGRYKAVGRFGRRCPETQDQDRRKA